MTGPVLLFVVEALVVRAEAAAVTRAASSARKLA